MSIKGAMIKAGAKIMTAEQKEGILKKTLDKALDKINKTVDTKSIKETKAFGEERTILLKILGFSSDGIMFVLTDNGVIRTAPEYNEPTCIITLSEDTFIEVARGNATFYDAICAYDADIEGEHIIRDFKVLSEIFGEFNHILKEESLGF